MVQVWAPCLEVATCPNMDWLCYISADAISSWALGLSLYKKQDAKQGSLKLPKPEAP